MEISAFSIFKNGHKSKESHPDWNITSKNEEGEFKTVGACWTKVTKTGDKYLSCVLDKPKNETTPKSDETTVEADGINW